MRICLVYDCLYPHTIGGGERYYRNLAERLSAEGHFVTYLTMRQWGRGETPDAPAGTRVVAVTPRMALYGPTGERRIAPPLAFGLGVAAHLARHGRDYDVVHTCSFPYFSLLAAGALRRRGSYRLVVDWFELWTRDYWQTYLGGVSGRVGWAVQSLCLRVPQRAFCFARLTEGRLRAEGVRGAVERLEGMWSGELKPDAPTPAEPLVVFAGRHIREKRVPAIVPAIGLARRTLPELCARILGRGPEHADVLRAIDAHGLHGIVEAPGFVSSAQVEADLAHALCMVLPSEREGYGLVVVEAAQLGTPSVVVAAPDNAATELVEDGVNGVVAASASPEDLAAAFERVAALGPALRESTAAWFGANAERLSLDGSLERVAAAYARGDGDGGGDDRAVNASNAR